MDKIEELKKLKAQLSNGELTQEQYDAAVIALDGADTQPGQPDPYGGQAYGQDAQQAYTTYGTGQDSAQPGYADRQQGYAEQQAYAGQQQAYAGPQQEKQGGYTGQQAYAGQQGYAGQYQQPGAGYGSQWQASNPGYEPKSKLAAGLFGIFLGSIGVHRFYLGYTGIGIAQIAVTIVTCGVGSIWGLIEGILVLTGSYLTTDANGVPLRE